MRPCSIYSRSLDRNARELSNLTPHTFEFEGVQCASMEGFLQALKYTDPLEQQAVCRLAGLEGKSLSLHDHDNFQATRGGGSPC